MILHTVAFRLHHRPGSDAETAFLQKANELRKLPGVIDFSVWRQTSKKNDFSFGLSMYFTSEQTYQAYNEHPDHTRFVNEVWLPQVADFMGLDYVEHSLV